MYRKRYKIYERADPQKHYLKKWRIVRNWAKAKHDLTTAELDMLLYLYGEKLFTREDCMNFGKLMSWDKERFGKLLKNGWLHKWRNNGPNQKALYEVTYKTRRFIDSLYKWLVPIWALFRVCRCIESPSAYPPPWRSRISAFRASRP